MAKQSKSLRAAYEKIDTEKSYPLKEAVQLMLEHKIVKFDATAELHMNLGIDPKHADQQVRTTLSLPHGTGKTVRIAVFCEDDQVKAAKSAGAVEAGDDNLIEKVSKGWTDFDVAVATPGMMKSMAKIARVLGPKGLMPNPKAGTVSTDVEKTVKELVGGRIEFRNDKAGIIHTIFGKTSFGEKNLLENLQTLIAAIQNAKPAGAKGTYIKSASINSTMGPGIMISVSE
jgi:large subunit ribosomal protein L1